MDLMILDDFFIKISKNKSFHLIWVKINNYKNSETKYAIRRRLDAWFSPNTENLLA